MTVKRQADLLGISRSGVYRKPPGRTIGKEELALRRLIDEIHTSEPTWGYRKITSFLKNAFQLKINKKRVRRIVRIWVSIPYTQSPISPGAITLSTFVLTCCVIWPLPGQTRYGAWISG